MSNKIIIDFDRTITVNSEDGYSNAMPNRPVIEKLRPYKELGFEITIFSARNMRTYDGNLGKINIHTLPVITNWLDRHKVPYDDILFGKPWSGYLEVFRGAGDSWSFVEPDQNSEGRVIRTTERVRISDLCCTGLYTFNSAELHSDYAQKAKASGSWEEYANEFYVAPIYNDLIEDGLYASYNLIPEDEVLFCGVPEDYEALQSLEPKVLKRRFDDSGME